MQWTLTGCCHAPSHPLYVVASEVDDSVCTSRERTGAPLLVPRGRDHASCAEQLSSLHCHLSDRAAGAKDKHLLPRLEVTTPGERHPGGNRGQPECGGQVIVDLVREHERRRLIDHAVQRHAAVPRLHASIAREPYSLSGRQYICLYHDADALHARNVGEPWRAEVGRA